MVGFTCSTGTDNKRLAQQYHDKLQAERWERDRLGAKPRRTWDEAVEKWLLETSHKRTQPIGATDGNGRIWFSAQLMSAGRSPSSM